MNEADLHGLLVWGVFGLAAVTAFALQFLVAPYGRHVRAGWGPSLPNRWAWVLMEAPASLFFLFVYLHGRNAFDLIPLCLAALWQVHYVNRTFVFPFRLRDSKKRMPLLIAALGFLFNTLNAYINARWISEFGDYGGLLGWLLLGLGALLFFLGMALNLHSDEILLRLRDPGQSGYSIPQGGGYRYVTCPNYLGELIEWSGWALASASLAGLSFAIYTAANLVPRAVANHRWYQDQFPNYPKERKALIPGLF